MKAPSTVSPDGIRGHNRPALCFCIAWWIFAVAVVTAIIPLLASAQPQPSCEQQIAECRQRAEAAIAAIQKEIDDLQSHRGDPEYQGPASTIYLSKMRLLTDQLRAEVEAKAKCSCNLPTTTGSFRPKYMVLTVVYAPPGTAGGHGASYVDYAQGSATGSKVSTSKSYKDEESITASVNVGGGGNSLDASFGLGWSESQASKDEVEVKKSGKYDIKAEGPGADGINHDEDKIYLWLNPQANVAVTGKAVSYWLVVPGGEPMDIQYVYVSEMKNPEALAKRVPDLANRLKNVLGFSADDYAQILANDPFRNGSTAIDANRFVLTSMTFPYEPPLNPTDGPTIQTLTLTDESTVTGLRTGESSNDIHVSVTASAGVAGIATATLKYEGKWTWTYGNSTETSAGSSQSATAAVGDRRMVIPDRTISPFTGTPFSTPSCSRLMKGGHLPSDV